MKITKPELKKFDSQASGKKEVIIKPENKHQNFKKFTFEDNSLTPNIMQAEHDSAVKQAYEKGLQEGQVKGSELVQQTVLTTEQSAIQALQIIIPDIKVALEKLDEDKKQFSIEMAEFTKSTVLAITKTKLNEDAENVIIKNFESLTEILSPKKQLKIFVNEKILDSIKNKIDKSFQELGLNLDVNLQADNNLEIYDAKIEWENSGVMINNSEKLEKVENLMTEYIKSF